MPRMPQITARELVRFLESQGFVEDRQSGSHLTLRREHGKISVSVRRRRAGSSWHDIVRYHTGVRVSYRGEK